MTSESRRVFLQQVKRVLWEIWDPIGVNDGPAAVSEYDSYAPTIVRLLTHQCSAVELDRHLSHIETTDMGLPERSSAARATAVDTLLALSSSQRQVVDHEAVVEALRAARGSLAPVQLAELLGRLCRQLSQGTLVMCFGRAFPDIPLRVLLDAGAWSSVSGGGMDEQQFNQLLEPWLQPAGRRS